MSRKTVAVVDCQLGNMFSVERACEAVGLRPVVASDVETIESADAVILPGVGAFAEAMEHLRSRGLAEALPRYVASGRPFLGICLGMQLLFSVSDEFGETCGLNIIPGRVRRFPKSMNPRVHVPYIGWNSIFRPADTAWEGTPLENLDDGEEMYFVHSYYVEPDDPAVVLCVSNYDTMRYCSGIAIDNVIAVQFHPEKSAARGLQVYTRFAAMVEQHSRQM